MKNSVILDIFSGDRGHMDSMEMPKEHFDKDGKLCETLDELKEKLSPGLFKLFEEHIDALNELFHEEINFYFKEGFKLGLRIGIECMED